MEAIKVLARGHQNLIWARTRQTNSLRSALREYYPAALEVFDDLHDRDTLAVLGRAPTLGEFGDDPDRYTTAKSRRDYAGTSPLTIASGKKRAVLARHVRNRRLYDAIDQGAFCALSSSPGAREFYDQRRDAGDLHH